ncbi:hypothetical protein ACSFA0_23260 [Variovorax sp. LT1P1]|uniref:hypothetical protein n=1 Tax=Variovorax sp. LT1P1 TaxID=3443730 RepID=UPI003F44CE0A
MQNFSPAWIFWGVIAGTFCFLAVYLICDKRRVDRINITQPDGRQNGSFPIRPSPPSISLGKLRQVQAREQEAWAPSRKSLEGERLVQTRFDYSTTSLEDLISQMSSAERGNLGKVLNVDTVGGAGSIATALRKAGTHSARNVLGGAPLPYRQVAQDAAEKIGVVGLTVATPVAEVERLAIEAVLTARLNSASPEERAKLIAVLGGPVRGAGIVTAAGGIVVANLSGFALYTGASTALAAAAGAFGVTLPFAVYTSMSSTMAALIGPVGWAGLAVFGIAKLGATNFKKTIPSMLAVAAARARLIEAQREALSRIDAELGMSDAQAQRLERMARFLRGYAGKTDDSQIPIANVPL